MLKIIPNKFMYSGVGSSDTVPVGDGLYLHTTHYVVDYCALVTKYSELKFNKLSNIDMKIL